MTNSMPTPRPKHGGPETAARHAELMRPHLKEYLECEDDGVPSLGHVKPGSGKTGTLGFSVRYESVIGSAVKAD